MVSQVAYALAGAVVTGIILGLLATTMPPSDTRAPVYASLASKAALQKSDRLGRPVTVACDTTIQADVFAPCPATETVPPPSYVVELHDQGNMTIVTRHIRQ